MVWKCFHFLSPPGLLGGIWHCWDPSIVFVTLHFPGSNLFSFMASPPWPQVFPFPPSPLASAYSTRLFFLLSLFPCKKLITSHFKSVHVTIIIYHVICKVPVYGPVCPAGLQAPLGALVPGTELGSKYMLSIQQPSWADSILQTMLAGRMGRKYYLHYIEKTPQRAQRG